MASNRWSESEAANLNGELELRVYSSRLLGSDPDLVLHGGGNTSVKISQQNLFGEEEEVLYVKGSGWDLATIEAEGFTPIRLQPLLRLAQLESLSDLEMVNQLKTLQTRAAAPTGSVEAILHAALPYPYVDHTHADAVVTLCNTPRGREFIEEIYGDRMIIVPYVMPGFDLARKVATLFQAEADADTIGLILLHHGIFTFGQSAKESYDRMITEVNHAEQFLRQHGAWDLPEDRVVHTGYDSIHDIARLRQQISTLTSQPMILRCDTSPTALTFSQHPDLATITTQGPATPDHVIRTKRLPMLGFDAAALSAYASAYQDYFEQCRTEVDGGESLQMLDPAPRVILNRQLGMICVGKSASEAAIVTDIYHHTRTIIQRAEKLGGWQALSPQEIFEVEYWELEQAKLRRSGHQRPLQGEIAWVSGAASGIGRACVESLLAQGAAVVGLDISPIIQGLFERDDFLGIQCDITDPDQLATAVSKAVLAFGGVDMVILNAGLFPGGTRIAEMDDALWRKVMSVNVDANLTLMRESYPLLELAPAGGRVVIIGSKNVPAPGPGAAAYSASKAALVQLARVAALEWAESGIRVNTLHPDAVFDTGLWTQEVLEARANHYGLSVADYKVRNLLKREIRSRDVAELATALCTPLFAATTGAQIPVDGGSERVI
ncbi:MAG: bifunctional aldolase/short-chain dehydrogenase [Gammaproteobacteria bacterium]|nr:bifunctional aldolase/short-chain dehydrogenase [Gammaproteobacteria bacterium]